MKSAEIAVFRRTFLLGLTVANGYNGAMIPRLKKKRIVLVNRDLQLRYTGAGLLAGLTSTLVTGFLLIYPLFEFKILTVGFFLPWPIFLAIGLAVILNCAIQITFGLVLTHRIAGPLFNLVRYLRMIAHGHWNVRMRQRKDDELAMVARHLNEMSEKLTQTVHDDILSISKIRSLVQGVELTSSQLDLLNKSLDDMTARLRKRIKAHGGIV